jgi:hypothetical protein
MTGDVALVVEHLPSKCEALSSNVRVCVCVCVCVRIYSFELVNFLIL